MDIIKRRSEPIARKTQAFRTEKEKNSYYKILIFCIVLSIVFFIGLLIFDNPVHVNSPSFWPIVKRRLVAIVAMLIAATSQSVATIAFQSISNNKVITPSLLGFEALYTVINTGIMYFYGLEAFLAFTGIKSFVIQLVAMVIFSLILYSWLLLSKKSDLQLMLLIGVVMGTGLRSASSFMRRVLAPSEFDILQARLFASVNNADSEYFPIAIPIVMVSVFLIIRSSKKLNILALGKDISTNLGVNYKSNAVFILVLVSILMAVSTALIGPLSFFGFLVASFSYEMCKSYDYKYVFPMALSVSYLLISMSYFVMNHIFNAQGVVSILIELVGGLVFLLVIFKKGNYDSN